MGAISSRLAVAVHILGYLTWRRGEATPSPEIAESVNTNPVVVRRLIGALRDAGLVSVQQGATGGASLARPPEEITLLDVYRAVEPSDELFTLHAHCPNPGCRIGGTISEVLQSIFHHAESTLRTELGGVTIAEVYEEVRRAKAQHDREAAAARAKRAG